MNGNIIGSIRWQCERFSELDALKLYKILQLRNRVFVVEQNCVYSDLDDRDQDALHLYATAGDEVIAGARILPAGVSCPGSPSIGRVVVAQGYRHLGIGNILMKNAIEICRKFFGNRPIKIAAQNHLREFYGHLGFKPVGDIFDEDGIPHITMQR